MSISRLQFEILNAMADDMENVEQVYLSVNELYLGNERFPVRYLLTQVIQEMASMLEEGFIEVKMSDDQALAPLHPVNPEKLQYYWFAPTPKGKTEWDAYPYEEESQSGTET